MKVLSLWETKPNVYCLCSLSNKLDHKDKCKDKNGVINNNYIIDATLGNDQATIRETKFVFDVEPDGFCYNDQLIDCFGVGHVSIFHTFRHSEGKTLTTPVYYVNNETEEIVYRDTWEVSCYADNRYFPGWDSSTMVDAYHYNGDC